MKLSIYHLLLFEPGHHDVNCISFVSTNQKNFLSLVLSDCWRFISFKFPNCCFDTHFCFLQCLHILLLKLVTENFPKSCYFCILMSILFDSVYNTHRPFNSHCFQAVLLVQESIHMSLHSLHRYSTLQTDQIVFGLTDVDFCHYFLQLIQGKWFVELYVQITHFCCIFLNPRQSNFCRRLPSFAFDDIADSSLQHVWFAVLSQSI